MPEARPKLAESTEPDNLCLRFHVVRSVLCSHASPNQTGISHLRFLLICTLLDLTPLLFATIDFKQLNAPLLAPTLILQLTNEAVSCSNGAALLMLPAACSLHLYFEVWPHSLIMPTAPVLVFPLEIAL